MAFLSRNELRQTAAYAALFLVLALVVAGNVQSFAVPTEEMDIYYSYVEGRRLLDGENPYERVLSSDFRTNDKYATYFPLFYELSALSQWAGLGAYPDWIKFWRVIFALFDVGVTILLFETCRRRGAWLLGVFAAGLWGLGRWSLFVVLIGHLDFVPIFCLLLSLLWLRERPRAAFLLFGLSLALKQIGIFLVPLYLIWAWQEAVPRRGVRAVLEAALLIAAIPVVASLPFLLWNAQGFFSSVLFSAVRGGRSHFGAFAVDTVLGMGGPLARIPMLVLLTCVYALALSKTIGRYTSCLLTFAVFVDFNAVFYTHYPLWVVPFVPTSALDSSRSR